MPVRITLHSRLPAEDAAQRILFAPPVFDHPEKGAPIPGTVAPGSGLPAAAIFPGGHFRSESHVARRLAHLDRTTAGRIPSRKGLQEFLRHENAFAPLAPEQRANLDAAGEAHAVFLLTGQQPGLLGGPILWYYKALTCAALARDWSVRLGRPVIPVFWVAGDDADLNECNHVELLDSRAADVHGDLRLAFPEADRLLAMSERRVDEAQLRNLLKRLGSVWNPEVLEQLGRAYPAPSSLSGGFLRLAQSRLGSEGILFVDGYSRNLRALARPVLEAAVDQRESWQAILGRGTALAEAAGIPAQVEIRDGVVHAFALLKGERHRLYGERNGERNAERKPGGGTLYLADRPAHDLRPHLAGIELTHDVFSRPLVADGIFPVLGHVLGPAELRYFAQLAPLFLETTGDMPLVQPRMTAAVAPESAFEAFLGEGMELPDLVRFGPAALRGRLIEGSWRAHPAAAAVPPLPAEKWLERARKTHRRHFPDAGPMERFEKDQALAWKRYRRSLEKAAYSGAAHRHRILFDHLRWLGNGMGQDRHLNLGSLLNAIGRDGLAELRNAVDPLSTELQLLKCGGE